MERKISLRHLRCFLAVAETRSFTIASSRMFLSQSSLTAAIKQFEESVGVKLFARTTRSVVLTDAGQKFRCEAERIVKEFDVAVRDLRTFGLGEKLHVRVASAPSVVQALLVPAISLLRDSFPDITFTVRDADANHIERMLISGNIDFGFTCRCTNYEELEYVPLLRDQYGVVSRRPCCHFQGTGPLRWRDLTVPGFVQFTGDTALGALLAAHPSAAVLYEKQRDEVSSSTTLYAMLGLNNTYSIIGALAADTGPFPDLQYRELIEPVLTREICLVTRHVHYMSPNTQKILDLLMKTFHQVSLPRGATLL